MNDSRSPGENPPPSNRWKLILGIGLAAALIAATKFFNFQGILKNALESIASLGPWGPAAFILIYIVLDRRAHIGFAGIAIGLTVALEAAFMGPITGASMNPARSLGPALIGGIWNHHWVYWVGPIWGAQLAVAVYRELSNGFRDFN